MHRLLVRQLRSAGVAPPAVGPEVRRLFELVNEAYLASDVDRELAERSLELTSHELVEQNDLLQAELSTRRSAESALRASEERYRVLFDSNPSAILVFDAKSLAIVECNAAAVALYGYEREELIGIKLPRLKDNSEDLDLSRIPPAPSEEWSGTKVHRRKDGTLVQLSFKAHGVMLNGRPAVLAMGTDVTETRRLEEQLRQSQKMEAIGLLAGGIAHDFNNIVAAILAYADFATSAIDPALPVAADIFEIIKAGQRAAALTHQLLAFSRKAPSRPRVIGPDSVVQSMSQMLRRVLGEDIALSTTLGSAPWCVRTDSGSIEQILLNLAVNARDAMPQGGSLRIGTRANLVDESSARALGIKTGEHVVLTVADTGCGMDEATRSRIFEPFFTTKEVGKGTGLGLSIVFGIVRQSGGAVSVRSEPGAGTEFHVYLPRTSPPPARLSLVPPLPVVGGSEAVLVVEDDEQVRAAVCRLLRASGYGVLSAKTPGEALEILAREGAGISVLLTDVVMPELDGPSLAARASRIRPGLRVVFMSGHTEHPAMARGPLGEGEILVRKPFTPHEITSALRQALDREAAAG